MAQSPGASPTAPSPLDLVVDARREGSGDSWTLDKLDLKAPGVVAQGSGRYGTDRTAIRADVDLDMAPFASTWLAIWLEGARGQGRGRLKVDLDMPDEGGRVSRQARGTITGTLDALTWSGLTMKKLDLEARLADGVMRIQKGDVQLNDGTCQLQGQMSYVPEVPTGQFTMSAKKVKIVKEMQPWVARVVPIFAGLGAVVVAELDLDLQGNGRGEGFDAFTSTLTGSGALGCRDGRVSSSPLLGAIMGAVGMPPELAFSSIATRFQMRDGGVYQDALHIDGEIVDIRMSGVTGFDGSLDHTLGLKPKATWKGSDKFQTFARILDPEGYVPMGIGGTVSAPTPKLPDPAKLVGNAVEGLLRRGLGDLLKPKKKDEEKK
ncbi:MAG: hypothetical protein KDA28_00880, partial [Phycisphaerales bacterium]|nr:hypothetical protein [Phycisphaerales bacterium]